ncbi:arginase [Photobacterium kishitanii]|uniref:Arginase n=1 Tax=Photobacterium kishitanii TaxID=318456 RepID=A0AAX0YR38_9GAMM|nr:arginase family protein [Photobacterium kishitanii]KJG53502.1 arginase [Photobacterium kishitanii]KJG55872.1 arginase [Photobacterium kishitanii]KJG62456.1 arginase [Photobacterium kishitanii]KJG64503.1 arginase [Photobacterium kishitanii]OBU31419.1 arginase [Photobacterium kishitanii]
MSKSFDIIGAPFNQLGFVTTKENTVNGIRRMDETSWIGLTDWIQVRNSRWHSDIVDTGDVPITLDVQELIDSDRKDAALQLYSSQLKSKLLETYHSGRIPITIGGDHSIAVGTLQATMEYYQRDKKEKVAIVWVDAHADINNSLDSNLHGKPLALLMNQYPYNDWDIPSDIAVNPEDVYYIGVRDLMRNEFDLINELNITNYDMPFIEKYGFNAVVEILMEKLEQDYDRVYLSFDYDALDGSIFRACATPNVGGLTAREALHLVHTISSSPKFVGADFVEYLPERDSNGVSKELMVKLIDSVWGFHL